MPGSNRVDPLMPAPKRHRGPGRRYSTPLPSYLPLGGRYESIKRPIKQRGQTYTDPRSIPPSQSNPPQPPRHHRYPMSTHLSRSIISLTKPGRSSTATANRTLYEPPTPEQPIISTSPSLHSRKLPTTHRTDR